MEVRIGRSILSADGPDAFASFLSPARQPSWSGSHPNNYPKLHNAAWPGVVGKGDEGAEPCIELATMLDLTAAALVDGIKFDGEDIAATEGYVIVPDWKAVGAGTFRQPLGVDPAGE